MNNWADPWDRREFLRGLTLMGSAGLVGLRPDRALAEPPPETTRIRLVRSPAICISPLYLAEELLRLEGFGDRVRPNDGESLHAGGRHRAGGLGDELHRPSCHQ